MFTALALTFAFAPPALPPAPQEAQPDRRTIQSLLEPPPGVRLESCPPARPRWNFDWEGWSRLVWEAEFLEREPAPFLSEDYWCELLDVFEGSEEALARRLFALAPTPVPLSYRLTLVEDGKETVVLEGTEPVRPGSVWTFGEHHSRQALVDFDVEIAQASFIADPVKGTVVTGSTLALELLPLPDGAYLVPLVARHAAEGENESIDLGYSAIQGGQRNPVEFEEAGTVARLVAGGTTTLALPGLDGRSFRLDLEVGGPAPRQEDPNLLYLPNLRVPPAGFQGPRTLRIPADATFSHEEEFPEVEVPDFEELVEGLLRDGDPWESIQASENGLIALKGAGAEDLRKALVAAALDRGRSAELGLEILLHQPGTTTPRSLARFAAPVVVGLPSGFSTGRVRESVTDWDVEVAQAARVADPVFALVEDGVQGTVRLVPGSAGAPSEVVLDLRLAALKGFESYRIQLDHELQVGPGQESTVPVQPEDRVIVEEPQLATMQIEGRYSLRFDGGKGTLRLERSSLALFGPGSKVEVRVEVR